MTNLIAQIGHEACVATSGSAAVRLVAELPPDVVLLDIQMPGLNGYETARRLRDRYGRQFPIFAVTADPVDISLAHQCGFDGIFAKPFSVMKLTALVSQLEKQNRGCQPAAW